MNVRETEAKSILNKHKYIDSWFLSRYGMNLYRGCTHNCVYCDGRAEGYYVEGEFGHDVAVKINAPQLLRKALDPRRKRVPLKRSFIMIGGGVGDSYQPAEKRYKLARSVLQVIEEYGFPVHILTKSCLVERDLDIIERINRKSRVIMSMSFSSSSDEISRIFEPGCTPPSRRLETLAMMKDHGIPTGMFLMPVIPGVTDTIDILDETICAAKKAGVDFVLFAGMTLKEGRQKDYYYNVLKRHYSGLTAEYDNLYRGDKWGNASRNYYSSISHSFSLAARKHGMPRRIPSQLFSGLLEENDLVTVLLQNLDYIHRLDGRPSPYRQSAYAVSRLKEPISTMKDRLCDLNGVGRTTERIILEILRTGTSRYHDEML